MIVTVTPNPAVDITYRVDRLVPGQSHRVTGVRARAGGKGINVARTLACMAHPATATAPVGGPAAETFESDLVAAGIDTDLVPGDGEIRRSVAVIAGDEATLFNEPGPRQSEDVWWAIEQALARRLEPGDVVVVSGSLPAGTPADFIGRLVRRARAAGASTILDLRGDPLSVALPERPSVVAPNAAEAAETTGRADPVAAGRALLAAGAGSVVVSRGADGLVAITPTGAVVRARLPTPLPGNPTGAGDALTAALAARLDGRDAVPESIEWWRETSRSAVAWSAAAVRQPVAGTVDPSDVAALMGEVILDAPS